MFKLTKEHEGKGLWCIPLGNNVPRGKSYNSLPCEVLKQVTKAKRVIVEIEGHSYRLHEQGQIDSRAVYHSTCNSGWIVFKSKEDLDNYKDRISKEEIIRKFFSKIGSVSNLSDEQILRVSECIQTPKIGEGL